MPFTYTFTEAPAPEDIAALERDLFDFFASIGAGPKDPKVAIFVRDESGKIVGGISAKSGWDQFYIETLFVSESARGQGVGARLMEMALEEGRHRKAHTAWLMTSTAEGKRFYERLGFTCFGEVERRAPSSPRWFMKQAL